MGAGIAQALLTSPLVTGGAVTRDRVYGPPAVSGTVLDQLQALNAWAIYPMTEQVSPYADVQGNGVNLTPVVANTVVFNAPGLLRGGTRGGGLWAIDGSNAGLVSGAGGPDAVDWANGGLWAVFMIPGNPASDVGILKVVYGTNNVSLDVQSTRGIRARCIFGVHQIESLAAAGTVSINTVHTLGVIQRKDGTGPRIILDGVDVTTSVTPSGSVSIDDWAAEISTLAAASTVATLTDPQRSIGGVRTKHVKSLPVIFKGSAPSNADLAGLHAAVLGTPTDFVELLMQKFIPADFAQWIVGGIGDNNAQMMSYGVNTPFATYIGTLYENLSGEIITDYNVQRANFGLAGGNPDIAIATIVKDITAGPSTTNLTGTYVNVFMPVSDLVADLDQYISGWGLDRGAKATTTTTGFWLFCVGDGAGHVTIYLFIHDLLNYETFRLGVANAYDINVVHSVVITQDGVGLSAWVDGASVALTATDTGGAGIATEWIGDVMLNFTGSPRYLWGEPRTITGNQQDYNGIAYFHGFTVDGDIWVEADAVALANSILGIF